jgi:hypothetical protein
MDGLDNDCDGDTDCEDADCDDGAMCVATPTSFALGTLVPESEPCPDGFTASETVLHRGLQDGGCEGCGCMATPTDCIAHVWTYASESLCNGDVNQTGGTPANTPIGFACTMEPINGGGGIVGGVRVSAFEVIQSCEASGTAAPAPAGWDETQKFCRVTSVGAGCEAGKACVPRRAPAAQCALVAGSSPCEGYAATQSWYTGYDDQRSCEACGCTADGGHCNDVSFALGSDWICTDGALVAQGQKACVGSYSPPGRLLGEPHPPTCAASASTTGSLDPTGQSTLCCME